MSDAALRHLRDALVLTNAAIAELAGTDARSAYNAVVSAGAHLECAIEHTEDPPISSLRGTKCI